MCVDVPNICSAVVVSVVLYCFLWFWGTWAAAATAADEAQRANLTEQQPQYNSNTNTTNTHMNKVKSKKKKRILSLSPFKTWGGGGGVFVRVPKCNRLVRMQCKPQQQNSTRDNRLSTTCIHRDRFVCTSLALPAFVSKQFDLHLSVMLIIHLLPQRLHNYYISTHRRYWSKSVNMYVCMYDWGIMNMNRKTATKRVEN